MKERVLPGKAGIPQLMQMVGNVLPSRARGQEIEHLEQRVSSLRQCFRQSSDWRSMNPREHRRDGVDLVVRDWLGQGT